MEIGVGEGGVGKTVTEGEERIEGAFIVGAVPDVDALESTKKLITVEKCIDMEGILTSL